MGIRYTKKQDEQEMKNTADPWHVIGMNLGDKRPLTSRTTPVVALAGGLSDIEIATFLDGNAGADLQMRVVREARRDPALQRLLQDSAEIDTEVERLVHQDGVKNLPLTALAASEQDDGSSCGLHCEEFVLQRRGIVFDDAELIRVARENGWLQDDGTRIGDVGNVLEKVGLRVTKDFGFSLDDVARLLAEGKDVIAVVDGGELVGDRDTERMEDKFIGEIPDHALVVTSVDTDGQTVEVHDPQSENERDTYPTEQFLDAWEDSGRYLVVVES